MHVLSGFLLLLGLLGSLATASVAPLKDVGALSSFLGKQAAGVALVDFYVEKEGGEVPEDLREAAKALESGDSIPVARVPASEEVVKKFEVTPPVLQFFAKGKSHGEEYGGDRGEDGSSEAMVDYARKALQDAQDQGIVKEAVEVEELKSSRKDRLCFTAEGLCVIYLADGSASKDEIKQLAKLKRKNTSKLSHGANARGTTLNWSWLDATAQPGFKALLNGDPPTLPGLVIYNPHKRLRYIALEEGTAATEESMQQLLDKVLGGDGRFTPAKGQKLPVFAGKEDL